MSKWADITFGGSVASGPTKHVVAYKTEGSFIDEMQVQEQKPYGTEFVVYDDSFNEVDSFHFFYQRSDSDGWKVTYYPNIEDMFISKDRWLIVSTGTSTTRYLDGYTHLGRSYIFIDLDNLQDLRYDEVNDAGDTFTYVTASFVVYSHIQRQSLVANDFPLQVTTLGGKEKIVTSAWESYPDLLGRTGVMSEEPWIPALYIHDIDEMIAAGVSSPRTVTLDSTPQKIFPFVGDGTPVEVDRGSTSQGEYGVYVQQGLDIGNTSTDQIRYALPNLSVGVDQIMVSDASKSYLYEYTNGSISETPVVVSKKFHGGTINGNQYHYGDVVYYDIIDNPEKSLRYGQGVAWEKTPLVEPFQLTEPDNYPNALNISDVTSSIESGPRELDGYNPDTGFRLPGWQYWVAPRPRKSSLYVDFKKDGTYAVRSSTTDIISSGAWLERPVYFGEEYSINSVVTKINDTPTNIFATSTEYTGSSFAPNVDLKFTAGSFTKVTSDNDVTLQINVEEHSNDPDHLVDSLHLDPSVPVITTLELSVGVSGISAVSSTEFKINLDMTLSGIADVDLSPLSPIVIFNTSFGLAYEGDDAATFYALDSMKPKVHKPDNAAGWVDELLLVDPNASSSVDFMYLDSHGPETVTLQFPSGWVDDKGDALTSVEVQNGSTYVAYLGSVSSGDDLSVVASSRFIYRDVDEIYTKTIPIQVANLV